MEWGRRRLVGGHETCARGCHAHGRLSGLAAEVLSHAHRRGGCSPRKTAANRCCAGRLLWTFHSIEGVGPGVARCALKQPRGGSQTAPHARLGANRITEGTRYRVHERSEVASATGRSHGRLARGDRGTGSVICHLTAKKRLPARLKGQVP